MILWEYGIHGTAATNTVQAVSTVMCTGGTLNSERLPTLYKKQLTSIFLLREQETEVISLQRQIALSIPA